MDQVDLLTFLSLVNKKLTEDCKSTQELNHAEMPFYNSTLTKRFFLPNSENEANLPAMKIEPEPINSGTCYVFNMENFDKEYKPIDPESFLSWRYGTNEDGKKLRETFEEMLRFKYVPFDDLKSDKVRDELTKSK